MKRVLALIMIAVLIITSAAGCKKKNKAEEAVTKEQNITSEEGYSSNGGASGNGVAAPERAPVGVWDIPIPELNPLGAQKLYTQTEYEKGSHELKYIENFAECKQYIEGEKWYLYVQDTAPTALDALETYAAGIGATVMDSQYDDRLIFNLSLEGDSLWWGDATLNDQGYLLVVMKQQEVPVGKEVTFRTEDYKDDDHRINFVTRSKGDKYQTLTVRIPNGDIVLESNQFYNTDMVEKEVRFSQRLYSEKTDTYVLDNIPQGEGVSNWCIRWEDKSIPKEITIGLNESVEIPYVKRGDELGGLKVCGVPFGSVIVEPAGQMTYEYVNGYSMEADITPEGDSLFSLPPGLWNVQMTTQEGGFSGAYTRLVPVSSGELTRVIIPDSLKSAYYTLNSMYAAPENVTGGITIVEAADKGTTGVIDLIVEDPKERDVYPDKENTTIIESGQKVDIVDITRQIQPPSIVLVLDSSGSMNKAMADTLAAAKEFIAGLPDKTYIKIVDFDTEVRVLDGETTKAVQSGLSKIKADGYTALYDATIQGLELVKGKDRPTVVVFSDGADSNYDGTGKGGSEANLEDVKSVAGEAGIPLYTIGFGDDPAEEALTEMAAASGGQYYSAKDNQALANVFTAINSKFGNYFTMTYNRPKEAANADTPVVAMVIDASGSMDIDPKEEEGCGYRIDKVKGIFHDFVLKLPDRCLMQLISFHTDMNGSPQVGLDQMTTSDKANILNAIGEIEAGGGTPIHDSLRMTFEALKTVPSNNKIIVFLTDAGLEVEEEEQLLFEQLLAEIKEENITVLFVGMGVDDKEPVFQKAAQLCAGEYIISEDSKVLNATLESILSIIRESKAPEKQMLSISINDKTTSGESLSYVVNTPVKFSAPPKSGKIIEPEPVKVVTGTVMKRYDAELATLLTGTSIPTNQTVLRQRMDMSASGTNNAMELAVKEAYLFDMFKGLEPNRQQFIALRINMKNIHKDKLQYQIPNFSSHFYINVNNEGMYPASDATWLTEQPISNPGNYEINLFAEKEQSGMLMFVIPDGQITQLSLHFYDTAYGHINIPLIGLMDEQLLQLKQLPKNAPTNIAEAFTMTVTAASDLSVLDIYEAPKDTSFRVIEAEFKSNVQALLNIDPKERLWLKTDTAAGPLMVKMSDVTAFTPFGFVKPRMLGVGSSNKVRMVYPIANALLSSKSVIFGDIQNGSLSVPIMSGGLYGAKSNKSKITENGISLQVNSLTTLENVKGFGRNWVVADLTVTDLKDGWGTWITPDFFQLVRADYAGEQSSDTEQVAVGRVGLGDFTNPDRQSTDEERGVEHETERLLYGIGADWGVFDNSTRRGLVLFTIPDDSVEWVLQSPYLTTLKEPLKQEAYPDAGLMVYKYNLEGTDDEFEQALEEAVDKAINLYQSTKSAYGDVGFTNTVSLEKGDGKNSIPVPTISYYGALRIKEVKTFDDVRNILGGLKCIINEDNHRMYSPEAVITQGWGNQWDLANLAMGLIAKNGKVPRLRTVNLTQSGKTEVYKLCSMEESYLDHVPGVSYIDQSGSLKIFVIPFMKDISELKGLVYLASNPEDCFDQIDEAGIRVSLKVEMDETTAMTMFGDIGDILGGGGEEGSYYEYIEMLNKEIPVTELSRDAIEIGYMNADMGKGVRYMAAINTADGSESGTGIVDTGVMKLKGLKIEIDLPGEDLVYETTLQEEEELDKIIHTIGINLPDLSEEAAISLEKAYTQEYNAARNPDSLSALKWYGRNILNRFIYSQSVFDRDMAQDLNLTLGRMYKPRCIMVTSRVAKDNTLRTVIDLLQSSNECHDGNRDNENAYNLMSGIVMSSLEAEALTGNDKISYLDLWGMAPEDTSLMFVMDNSELRELSLEAMKAAGNFPDHMIKRIEETDHVIITTDKPILYKGEERWAWLEINPSNFETISVFDTGEHGGMAEYTFSLQPGEEDGGKYIVGAFIGVDVGVWSMASSSLKFSNYKQIVQDAMNNAKKVGAYLNQVMSGVDSAKNKDFSALSLGDDAAVKYEIKVKWGFDLSLDLAQNIVGFEQGFNDGLSVYFTYARYGKQ